MYIFSDNASALNELFSEVFIKNIYLLLSIPLSELKHSSTPLLHLKEIFNLLNSLTVPFYIKLMYTLVLIKKYIFIICIIYIIRLNILSLIHYILLHSNNYFCRNKSFFFLLCIHLNTYKTAQWHSLLLSTWKISAQTSFQASHFLSFSYRSADFIALYGNTTLQSLALFVLGTTNAIKCPPSAVTYCPYEPSTVKQGQFIP